MPTLPDQSVSLVLCDPPYGITSARFDSPIPLDCLWPELWRVCSGPIVLTASQPFSSQLVCSQLRYFKHEWIWIKNRGSNFANTVREPMKEHEQILVFARGKWTYNRQMQARSGSGADRVKYSVAFRTASENYRAFEDREANTLPELRVPSSWQKFNTEVGLHPQQKPTDLFRYLVRTYSNEGDTVLDFTAGSGTTGEAARAEGRGFICIEKEQRFVETMRRRLGIPS